MTAEEWRPIVGFPDYMVSDKGRVLSTRRREPRVLRANPTTNGYLQVLLWRPEGGRRAHRVHVLVAEAFYGPRPNGHQVRHLDGNQLNNCRSNLAYGTARDNAADMKRHGTHHFARRSACKNGHPFDEQNTRHGRDRRYCRACDRDKARRYQIRRAQRAAAVPTAA